MHCQVWVGWRRHFGTWGLLELWRELEPPRGIVNPPFHLWRCVSWSGRGPQAQAQSGFPPGTRPAAAPAGPGTRGSGGTARPPAPPPAAASVPRAKVDTVVSVSVTPHLPAPPPAAASMHRAEHTATYFSTADSPVYAIRIRVVSVSTRRVVRCWQAPLPWARL